MNIPPPKTMHLPHLREPVQVEPKDGWKVQRVFVVTLCDSLVPWSEVTKDAARTTCATCLEAAQ